MLTAHPGILTCKIAKGTQQGDSAKGTMISGQSQALLVSTVLHACTCVYVCVHACVCVYDDMKTLELADLPVLQLVEGDSTKLFSADFALYMSAKQEV